MQKKWLSILLFAPLMQSNYVLADQAAKKELDYKALGEVLFFDKSISFNKTQSCSTCHSPDTAFVDQRKNSANQMVSEGDNPHLHGNRNANTALYAMFSPNFHFDKKIQDYVGGQFWDGRAKDLAEQAGGPPVNPVEMGMPDKKAIVERLKADPTYYKPITDLYGESIWADADKIYAIMEKAIGEFEKQELFAQFSSKYDRALKGEAELTALESKGKALFFDKTRTNCSNCHQSSEANSATETFTNYRYFNIGVPSNQELIKHNKLAADFVDNGLLDNPMVKGDEKQKGKFKVPTLRNIGVTAPYMHNGVFRDLKTVLLFKDSFNNPNRKINPETGKAWEKAEYAQTINPDVLKAKPLTDEEIKALEAFLKTLTDEAYEE
ncbi:cytochrome c peroxidase [uncultured Haemophilus sp.]|uniref:cytochrome-c peroxidase n=1 Tax=uncultured Haemophilus sp. TaxID=237779 RepID=UPI002804AF75|nr:cytochrome c peroxidase [uncultured Haemophilus sp.]